MTYAPAVLYRQLAYVAYHFHWSLDEIAGLDHLTRARFVEEIGRLNEAGEPRG